VIVNNIGKITIDLSVAQPAIAAVPDSQILKVPAGGLCSVGVEASWPGTGNPVGNLLFYASNTFDEAGGGNWVDVTSVVTTLKAIGNPTPGAADGFAFTWFPFGYKYLAVIYNRSSGGSAGSPLVIGIVVRGS
jgi:hypothetical protein